MPDMEVYNITVCVLIFSIYHVRVAAGPLCLSCDSVQQPGDCNTTLQCRHTQACFIRRFTSYGEERYRLGCMDLKYCSSSSAGAMVGRRQSSVANCSVCCSLDTCNAAACSATYTGVYPLVTLGMDDSCQDRDVDTCTAFGKLSKDACRLQHVADMCPRSCGLCAYFGWGSWGSYGACSRTCNPGLTVRRRVCEHQVGDVGGQACPGPDNQPQPCLNFFCSAMAPQHISETCGNVSATKPTLRSHQMSVHNKPPLANCCKVDGIL